MYTYVATIAAPWHGAAGDTSGGHRRRSLLAAATSWLEDDSSSSSGLLGHAQLRQLQAAQAAGGVDPAQLQALLSGHRRALKQQLSHPRRVLGAAAPPADGSSAAAAAVAPQVTMQIMQRNATKSAPVASPSVGQLLSSVIPASDYGFSPVSQPFLCHLKDGAAIKCNAAFTEKQMTAAWRRGEDAWLVMSLNVPGQVRGQTDRESDREKKRETAACMLCTTAAHAAACIVPRTRSAHARLARHMRCMACQHQPPAVRSAHCSCLLHCVRRWPSRCMRASWARCWGMAKTGWRSPFCLPCSLPSRLRRFTACESPGSSDRSGCRLLAMRACVLMVLGALLARAGC